LLLLLLQCGILPYAGVDICLFELIKDRLLEKCVWGLGLARAGGGMGVSLWGRPCTHILDGDHVGLFTLHQHGRCMQRQMHCIAAADQLSAHQSCLSRSLLIVPCPCLCLQV
jgi:hypothetical protein